MEVTDLTLIKIYIDIIGTTYTGHILYENTKSYITLKWNIIICIPTYLSVTKISGESKIWII